MGDVDQGITVLGGVGGHQKGPAIVPKRLYDRAHMVRRYTGDCGGPTQGYRMADPAVSGVHLGQGLEQALGRRLIWGETLVVDFAAAEAAQSLVRMGVERLLGDPYKLVVLPINGPSPRRLPGPGVPGAHEGVL